MPLQTRRPRSDSSGVEVEPKEAQEVMLWKRTTAPDGIPGSPGPPHTADHPPASRRASRVSSVLRVGRELVRSGVRVRDRPTLGQLRTMSALDGHSPASYPLDPAVSWLPESLPADFPHGGVGLRFAHAGGELVALPNGWGFRPEA